jgi:hypothetical protein
VKLRGVLRQTVSQWAKTLQKAGRRQADEKRYSPGIP